MTLGDMRGDWISAGDMGLDGLGEVGGNVVDEAPEPGKVEVALQYVEPLAFAWEHYSETYPELFDTENDDDDEARGRWIAADAEAALRRVVAQRYGVEMEVDGGDAGYGGDDPHVTFLWWVTLPETASPEDVGEAAWDVAARLTSELDPGTFGAEYLFRLVADEMKKESK
jgi:hypothetical protein